MSSASTSHTANSSGTASRLYDDFPGGAWRHDRSAASKAVNVASEASRCLPTDGDQPEAEVVASAGIRAIEALEAAKRAVRPVLHCLYARIWLDAADREANSELQQLQADQVALQISEETVRRWLGGVDPAVIQQIAEALPELTYYIARARQAVRHALPAAGERAYQTLAAPLAASWVSYYRQVSADLRIRLGSQSLDLATGRGLRRSTSSRRQELYEAEAAAWHGSAGAFAAALQAVKGSHQREARERGYQDALDHALAKDGVSQQMLAALHSAIDEALPALRQFYVAKAEKLEVGLPLPAWHLDAPPLTEEPVTWRRAETILVEAAATVSEAARELVRRAFADDWIDHKPRANKRLVSFCVLLRDGQSRIGVNFDGSRESLLSAAHELGHAYQYSLLTQTPTLNQQFSLCMAELPSYVSELSLVRMPDLRELERSSLLHAQSGRALQTIVLGRANFEFERLIHERIEDGPLTSLEVHELSAQCRAAVLGDAASATPDFSWMARPHNFTASFQNWQYSFALLAAYAIDMITDRSDFDRVYPSLLKNAGARSVEESMRALGFRCDTREFWLGPLASLNADIQRVASAGP